MQTMKKFAKITAIIALVMTVLGVTLLSIGAIGGGIRALKALARSGQLSFGPEDLKGLKWIGKWNYKWNIWDDSIGWNDDVFHDDVWDGDVWDDDLWDDDLWDDDDLFDPDFELFIGGSTIYEADASEVKNLQVQLGGSDVQFVQWDKDMWRVEAKSIGKFQSYVEGDTLKILGIKKGINLGYFEVTVYMPGNAELNKAEIAIGAGDMEIESLAADKAAINVGAGSLTIKDLQADKLLINTGAGEVKVRDGVIGDMELATGMGSLNVKGKITGDIYSSVAMGAVEVVVCGSDEKDHNYELSCAAGEMRVGSRYNAGLGMDMSIDNDASTTYKLDCAMGSTKVTFRPES